MDHRCGERRAIGTTVLLRRRGWAGWVVAELADLSISGAYLRLQGPGMPLRAQVRLEAPRPDGTPGLMHCNAMVVRVDRGGVALMFDELAPRGLAPLFARLRQAAAPVRMLGTA
jgi:hypothetical protein